MKVILVFDDKTEYGCSVEAEADAVWVGGLVQRTIELKRSGELE